MRLGVQPSPGYFHGVSLFRKQAVRQYADPDMRGGLLRVLPPSGARVMAVLSTVFVVLAVLAVTRRVNVTAQGRGVVRPPEGVFVVRSPIAGEVMQVTGRAGSDVKRGQPLFTLAPPPAPPPNAVAIERVVAGWKQRAAELEREEGAIAVAQAWRRAVG